jgi:phage shock protein A
MATLLQKVQTLISANLHWLVDKALEQKLLAVINQHIREVEDNLKTCRTRWLPWAAR